MTDIFPEDVREASDKMGGEWVTASEFEGEGLVLQLIKPLEKVKSFNPKYGAGEADFLVKKELLDVGETFRYTFKNAEGVERNFDSKSGPFFIGIKQVEELGVGDWIHITRTGKLSDTRFSAVKVDEPALSPLKSEAKVDYPVNEFNENNSPF